MIRCILQLMLACCPILFSSIHAQETTQNQPITPNNLLLEASLHGNFENIKKAVSLGAKLNSQNAQGDTALNMAAKLSYFFIVDYLVSQGADVNKANQEKITPLHYVVEYNNIPMIRLLLKKGANINARDKIDETPLHWAAWTGNIKAAKLLLKQGANLYAPNNTGVTPLDLTIKQEHHKLENIFRKLRYQRRFST